MVIKNTTPFVVQIAMSGDVGSLSRTSVNGDAAGAVIAATTNQAVLPPDYQVTVPVGSGGASFTVQGNPNNVTYLRLRALEGFIPGNVFADYEAISGFAGELSDDSSEYAQCTARSTNFIETAACSASLAWNVNFAADRLAVQTGVQLLTHSGSLGALLNLINTADWAEDAVTSILDLRGSPLSFSVSAVPTPSVHDAPPASGSGSPPTSNSGTGSSPPVTSEPGSPGAPSGGGATGSISVAWGSNAAPAGDWMDVTFTNFPTGEVSWNCVEGGTSYGPYSTTITSSTETLTANTCYDTDAGDTDYFTADGINSNTIPADTPAPPPSPPSQPAPSSPSISVGWGPNAAPAGDWMDVTFTNFPTGRVSWYCVEGGTSYGPYSTTITSSTETLTANTCYDTERGDTDYFTADGINSNTIPAD